MCKGRGITVSGKGGSAVVRRLANCPYRKHRQGGFLELEAWKWSFASPGPKLRPTTSTRSTLQNPPGGGGLAVTNQK